MPIYLHENNTISEITKGQAIQHLISHYQTRALKKKTAIRDANSKITKMIADVERTGVTFKKIIGSKTIEIKSDQEQYEYIRLAEVQGYESLL